MTTSTKLKIVALLCILSAGGGAFGGFKAGGIVTQRQAEAETQRLAIAHECGAYDAKTGKFGWLPPATIDAALLQMPVLRPAPRHAVQSPIPTRPATKRVAVASKED